MPGIKPRAAVSNKHQFFITRMDHPSLNMTLTSQHIFHSSKLLTALAQMILVVQRLSMYTLLSIWTAGHSVSKILNALDKTKLNGNASLLSYIYTESNKIGSDKT